jgi:hypothetical protein
VRVLTSNARAIACHRKCGFVEEGREREAVSVKDGWQDDLILGLLDVIGARFMPRRLAAATPQARRRDHLRVRVINADAAS